MKDLVLVDSSVWIAATRKGGDTDMITKLSELIHTEKAAMCHPVWLELYQGIKGKSEEARLIESRKSCHWLEFDDACWTTAASTARCCLRAGTNVHFGDVLVHACAARYDVELLERDRHFEMIRKAIGG